MPLRRCTSDGKRGWKYGESGHCYTGPGAKKKAIKQGIAEDGPEGFKSNASQFDEVIDMYDVGDCSRDGDISDVSFRAIAELADYLPSEIDWMLGFRSMRIEAKTYEVKYERNGRTHTTSVSAKTVSDAKKYVRSEYPDATIIDAYEV